MFRKNPIRSRAGLVFLALLSCGSEATAPEVDPAAVPIEFAVDVLRFDDPSPTIVEGGAGEIVVQASLFTGNHGYELRPELRADGALRLSIVAEFQGGITIPAHYRYEARLRELPAGRYRLQLEHRVPRESRERWILDTVVDVR